MKCPYCGAEESKVIDSRPTEDSERIRRRRECLSCGYRYTTIEGIIPEELKVVKRTGDREEFDRDKLRRGIANACYKRPVTPDDVDKAVEEVATSLLRDFDKEVASSEIGRRVMERLRGTDQVAYVRFASVYRKFQDVDEFIEEIRQLK